jgi:hypothetical protein
MFVVSEVLHFRNNNPQWEAANVSYVIDLFSAVAKVDWQQGRCYSCLNNFIDILNSSNKMKETLLHYA